jgi:hypothetical protein
LDIVFVFNCGDIHLEASFFILGWNLILSSFQNDWMGHIYLEDDYYYVEKYYDVLGSCFPESLLFICLIHPIVSLNRYLLNLYLGLCLFGLFDSLYSMVVFTYLISSTSCGSIGLYLLMMVTGLS